jgi:hypothetical protein
MYTRRDFCTQCYAFLCLRFCRRILINLEGTAGSPRGSGAVSLPPRKKNNKEIRLYIRDKRRPPRRECAKTKGNAKEKRRDSL